MKPTRMKIPPLSELYERKQDYEVHIRKLQKIMSDRKGHLHQEASKDVNPRKYYNNFQRKYNTKSVEIARANSKIVKKIEKAKPSFSFKSVENLRKPSESRASQSLNSRSKILEQERENYRIRNRVQSMSSSLNKDSLMRDYQRSMQIKNRIMHFKTQSNNKVTLKANRYLSSSKVTIDKQKQTHEDSLPRLADSLMENREGISAQKLTKELINMKMRRVGTNIASYYKKDDILRNKVLGNNKLFQMAREKRSKAMSMMQNQRLGREANKQKEDVSSNIFPTELSKPLK